MKKWNNKTIRVSKNNQRIRFLAWFSQMRNCSAQYVHCRSSEERVIMSSEVGNTVKRTKKTRKETILIKGDKTSTTWQSESFFLHKWRIRILAWFSQMRNYSAQCVHCRSSGERVIISSEVCNTVKRTKKHKKNHQFW